MNRQGVSRAPARRMALAGGLSFLLAVALSACGGDPRPADAAPAPAPASADVDPAPVPDVAQLVRDRTPALFAAALASDSDDSWAARLEALRQIRHQRPPGLAAALVHRAIATRNEQEQVIALDVLFASYPTDAIIAVDQLAAAYAGERTDLDRLAATILRHHCVAGYGPALGILEAGGEDELADEADAIAGAGVPLATLLRERADVPTAAPARRALDLALAALADPAAAAPDHGAALNAQVDAAVVAADFPPAATAVALARPAPLMVSLAHQAFAAGVTRPDIIDALGRANATDTAPVLLIMLTPPHVPETRAESPMPVRAACLRALGAMKIPAVLPTLLADSQDDTCVKGEAVVSGRLRYGGDSWPLAEAALAGLATMPGDQAKQGLLNALTHSERPSVVVAAAEALARRGDRAVLPDLEKARDALDAHDEAAAWIVTDAMASLAEKPEQTCYQVYLVRYRGPGLAFTLVTDQPVIPNLGFPFARNPPWNISQESFLMTAADIARAISQRNSQHLDRLVYGPDKIDDVDLLAR